MKNIFKVIILALYSLSLFGQEVDFLQKIDYDIKAYIHEKTKIVDGEELLYYQNNSNTSLNELYFHLHANAYKNKNTHYAKRLIKNKNVDFYFSKKGERGGYESINFSNESNNDLAWEFVDNDKEIVKVKFEKPIKNGSSINIKIKFKLKIPKAVNRLGYMKEQMNFVNWYPKVAVFDKKGWQTMNSNTNGYIYSDFGNYKIEINTPEEYQVIAGGHKELEEEVYYQNLKYKRTVFTSTNVTDFGFVISKNMLNSSRKVKLLNDKIVNIQLFYSPEIKKFVSDSILGATERTILYLSKRLGNYPYSSLSIVIPKEDDYDFTTPLLINQGLKKFKHISKFQRSLIDRITSLWIENLNFNCEANNYPSFVYGLKYFYSNDCKTNVVKIERGHNYFDNTVKKLNDLHHFNLIVPQKPIKNDCTDNCNTFWSIIGKSSLAYNYLQDHWGKKIFDKKINSFIEKWRYKHPYPEDFENHLKGDNKESMDWFFDGMLNNTKPLIYTIKSVKKSQTGFNVEIENKGKYKIPFKLGSLVEAKRPKVLNIDGFLGTKQIEVNEPFSSRLKIDPFGKYFRDINLKNKYKVSKKLRSNRNLRFNKNRDSKKFIIPTLGINYNDGLMLGLLFHSENYTNEILAIPMYGFRSKSIVGTGYYSKSISIPSIAKVVDIGIEARSFHKNYNKNKGFNLRYSRISPFITADLTKQPYSGISQFLRYSFSYITDDNYNGTEVYKNSRYVNQLNYIIAGGNVITPYELNIGLRHQYFNIIGASQNLSVSAELKTSFMYKKNSSIHLRLYASTFLMNKNPYSDFSNLYMIGYNQSDYTYDQYYFDRSAQDGFLSRQISLVEGSFKTAISNSAPIGKSRKYIVAANFRFDLPMNFFIKPYLDLGMYSHKSTISDTPENKILYSGGLVFEVVKDYLEFYLPIINSKEIENYYKSQGNYFNRISFMLNLNFINRDSKLLKEPFK